VVVSGDGGGGGGGCRRWGLGAAGPPTVGYLESERCRGVYYNIIHTRGPGRIMPKARRRPAGGAGVTVYSDETADGRGVAS